MSTSPSGFGEGGAERRHSHLSRPARVKNSGGRRKTDKEIRAAVTKKAVAGIVFLINFLYLVGEVLVGGHHNGCF